MKRLGLAKWAVPSAAVGLMATALVSDCVQGQQPPGLRIVGIAFDSVRNKPLAGAMVSIVGRPMRAETDSLGRFAFDADGDESEVAVQHPLLDSLGFFALRRKLGAGEFGDTVVVATPSAETIWSRACGRGAQRDSAIVFGRVNVIGPRSIGDSIIVEISWLDFGFAAATGLVGSRHRRTITADQNGSFGLCGVPLGSALTLRATSARGATGPISVSTALPIIRRDLLLVRNERGGVATGSVVGRVIRRGEAVSGVRVVVSGAKEARSGVDGSFTLHGVPAGSQDIELLGLGLEPARISVDVPSADSISVIVEMRPIQTLAAVDVRATAHRHRLAGEIDRRRELGFGVIRDSAYIRVLGMPSSALREVPSVVVRETPMERVIIFPGTQPGGCRANVWIDGFEAEQEEFFRLRPHEIGVLEVYPRISSTPAEFVVRRAAASPRAQAERGSCGSIVVWTTHFLP